MTSLELACEVAKLLDRKKAADILALVIKALPRTDPPGDGR